MVTDREKLLEALVPLAMQARKIILEVYTTNFHVEDKGGNDPVTIADQRANEFLCEGIAKLTPGIPIVAEESAKERYQTYTTAPEAFFVDPLDGTREFVAKNGEFVVMIGFAEQGRATAGLMLAPTTGLLWIGSIGHGAEERNLDGHRRTLRLSEVTSIADARAVISRHRRPDRLLTFLETFPPRQVIPLGSGGLKGAAVARGDADLFLQIGGAGSLWDTCAPEAILRAAGGLMTHPNGEQIDYQGALVIEDGLVAAAPPLHRTVIEAIRSMDHGVALP